jgi:hypothetical protein
MNYIKFSKTLGFRPTSELDIGLNIYRKVASAQRVRSSVLGREKRIMCSLSAHFIDPLTCMFEH